jgi:hypothetical protein
MSSLFTNKLDKYFNYLPVFPAMLIWYSLILIMVSRYLISREKFIKDTVFTIKNKLSTESVIALSTNNVVYFLILQPNSEQIKGQVEIIKERWKGQIIISEL